jgi:thiamine transporter ThiT
MKSKNIQILTEGGMCIALSLLLWYLKIGEMPQGGSISLQMLPLFIFSLRWGIVPGIFIGLVYGLVHSIQDLYVVHWFQYFLDYPLAFSLIGLAGLVKGIKVSRVITLIIALLFITGSVIFFVNISSEIPQAKKRLDELKIKLEKIIDEKERKEVQDEINDIEFKIKWYPISRIVILISGILGSLLLIYGAYLRKTLEPIELGVFIGGLGRLIAHFLSGIIFFSQYAPPGTPAWLYSLIYNFFVVVPSTFICLPIILLVFPRIQKVFYIEK